MKGSLLSAFVLAAGCVLYSGCVTINVYFPAVEAQRAADEFIRDVLGPEAESEGEPQAAIGAWPGLGLLAMLTVIVPDAHAQADIDIDTPQINAIKARMAQRQRQFLGDYFDAGAIGLSNDGLVEIRDRAAVPLKDRRALEQHVADENRDRLAVYREIALANGQPDWESQIRDTFAQRWIANARTGWYYQEKAGGWVRK